MPQVCHRIQVKTLQHCAQGRAPWPTTIFVFFDAIRCLRSTSGALAPPREPNRSQDELTIS